jgi:hypothetical protein
MDRKEKAALVHVFAVRWPFLIFDCDKNKSWEKMMTLLFLNLASQYFISQLKWFTILKVIQF